MNKLSTFVVMAVALLAASTAVHAQSAEQLDRIQTACLISPEECEEAVASLRFGLDRLPNAPRRAAIANIANSLQGQAVAAPGPVLINISRGLAELTTVIEDPVQLAAVQSLIEDLNDGTIDGQAAFNERITELIQRALVPDSAG